MQPSAVEFDSVVVPAERMGTPIGTRLLAAMRRRFGATARVGSLGLVDQALMSGTSFLTGVLVARAAGETEMGLYALGFTIVMVAWCVQEALVSSPFTVLGNRLSGVERSRFAGSALIHTSGLALILVPTLITAALLNQAGIGPPGLSRVIWVLAFTVPCLYLREFGRRFAFAELNIRTVLFIDLAVSLVQFAGLLWLFKAGAVSAASTHAVIGVAGGIVGACWLALTWSRFHVRPRVAWPAFVRSWSFGKWVLIGQIVWVMHVYLSHWLLAMMLDEQATGVYAACMSIVLFSNPFIIGVSNVLTPRAARAMADGGAHEVRRVITWASILMAGVMLVFCLGAILGGDWLIRTLYGADFGGHAWTISILAIAVLVGAVGKVSDDGLRAMERPDFGFRAGFWGMCLMLVTTFILLPRFTLLGAAIGLLAGNAVSTAIKCLAFSRLVSRSAEPAFGQEVAALGGKR